MKSAAKDVIKAEYLPAAGVIVGGALALFLYRRRKPAIFLPLIQRHRSKVCIRSLGCRGKDEKTNNKKWMERKIAI